MIKNPNCIQIIQTTPQELDALIGKSLKEQLEELKLHLQPKQPTEWLTRKEVADLFKINLSTLFHWTNKGKLKAYGIGNRVYYKRSEVDAMIQPLKL
ncbi:DNA-binding protein [Apibacter muscae]|uniref:DNA-binding protein n=1 Tax=Apibacter muscae TaxID=2509004 RepID=A0A563DGC8_9FLAO|nr:helix-turn-helix domain-containing protein [Apibacter muscae]TWP29255.1 DNA-binding protein [Apibacter muscae]